MNIPVKYTNIDVDGSKQEVYGVVLEFLFNDALGDAIAVIKLKDGRLGTAKLQTLTVLEEDSDEI